MTWPVIENVIVALILIVAAVYIGRRAYRSVFKKTGECHCDGCPSVSSCQKYRHPERSEGSLDVPSSRTK